MTDFSTLLQPDKGQPATPLLLVGKERFDTWLKGQPERVRQAVAGQGFKGESDQLAILPGEKAEWSVAIGAADAEQLGLWSLAKAAEALPEGTYRVAGGFPGAAALGWLLGQYRFDRYKQESKSKGPRILLTDSPRTDCRGVSCSPRQPLWCGTGQHPRRRSRTGGSFRSVEQCRTEGASVTVTAGAEAGTRNIR
jgi:hypothetical protein